MLKEFLNRAKGRGDKKAPGIRLFFKQDRSVRLPWELSGKRPYILPNRQGLLFLVILFVMLLGSLNYNNNLGFIFTFLLGSMSVISILHTHRNLSGLTVISASASPVFANETAVFKLTLRPVLAKHPDICLNFAGGETVVVTLNGLRDHTVEVPLTTTRRGIFKPPALTIATYYPLGIFRAWAKIVPDTDLLVYPEALAGPFETSRDFSGRDNEGEVEVAGVDDFKELKRYVPGDPVYRLSWKTYAKGRGLYTKEFSGKTGASLIFDYNDLTEANTEEKLSRLCDLVLKAHNMNLEYGLTLPGRVIAPGEAKDPHHKHACLKALALFQKGEDVHEKVR